MITEDTQPAIEQDDQSANHYVWEEFPQRLSERAGYDGLYESIDTDALEEVLGEFTRTHGRT